MIAQFRLHDTDCVEIANAEHCVASQGIEGFVFRRMDGAGGDVTVRQQDYPSFLKRPDVLILPRHFWAGRAAARLKSDVQYINTLSKKARRKVYYKWNYVKFTLEAWSEGRVSKTEAAINEFMPELEELVRQLGQETRKKQKIRWDSAPSDPPMPPPSARTLLEWMRDYVNAQHSPIGLLRKGRHPDSYYQAFSEAEEGFLKELLLDFLDPRQPTPRSITKQTREAFKKRNREREAEGKSPLKIPSDSTIYRRIIDLDQFNVMAHRRGPGEAKRIMAIFENGIFADYPMERVEMDEWEVDVLTLFKKIGVVDKLDPKDAAKLNIGRRWICVAIDCATRCIVGFKISEKPSGAETLDTLASLLRDKSDIARALGCEHLWNQYGRPDTLYTDMGTSLANQTVSAALADLKIQYLAPPAGVPKLRARIERLFGTFAIQLMELLPGRVFSNPAQRGDYPSQQQAVLNDDDLLAVFVTFIVDIYHNSKHGGLSGETPANAWRRLQSECLVTSPPDANTQRAVFGIPLERTLSTHGVCVNSINYLSEDLTNTFQKYGKKRLKIRLDPNNLGYISVQFGTKWKPAKATVEVAQDMALDEWVEISTAIREKHRDEAVVYEDSIARALQRIRQHCDTALRRAGKTLFRHTKESVDRAREDLFMGLTIVAADPNDGILPSPGGGPFGTVFGGQSVARETYAIAPAPALDGGEVPFSESNPEIATGKQRWRRRND